MAVDFHGSRKTTKILLAANTAEIEAGDLVYLASNSVFPASSQADGGTAAQNQLDLVATFLGVSQHSSASGTTDAVLVDTGLDVEYGFTAASAVYRFGDLLGADENSGGDGIEDQSLIAAADFAHAIAIVTDDSASARTTVKCRLVRTVARPIA